jgi:hypothetical protein
MQNVRIITNYFITFWENLCSNTSLLKISVAKTEINDSVVPSLTSYLGMPHNKVLDLDLSLNLITDRGI